MEWSVLNNVSVGNKLTTNFAADWAQDGRILLVTDASVSVFNFDLNTTNAENTLNIKRSEVKVSEYHAAEETGIEIDDELYTLTKENLYNAILNYNLTPKTSQATTAVSKSIKAVWSTFPNDKKSKALLAVISNTGNVEIYTQYRLKWILLNNLTQLWVHHLKETSWVEKAENNASNKNYLLHTRRVNQALATCCAWSKIYNDNDTYYFIFVMGHIAGLITVWKYFYTNNNTVLPPIFLKSIDTNYKNITSIHICSSNKLDWIIFGNIDGKTSAIPITNSNPDTFQIDEIIELWEYKDVRVSKIIDFKINELLCLLIIKGPFIIICALNDSKQLICVKHINAKNINITGIVSLNSNSFVVATLTGSIKVLEITFDNNEFNYTMIPVESDLKWEFHACYGLIKSPSNILWGVVTHPCKMTDHLLVRNSIQINFMLCNDFNPEEFLKTNQISHLHNAYECIDILRCISAKSNTFPLIWLTNYKKFDNLSVLELRLILWISTFCQTFLLKKPKYKKLTNPLPDPNIIKKIILFKFRLNRINKLLDKFFSINSLNSIEMDSLYLLYDNVKQFQNDEDFKIYFEEKTAKDLINVDERIQEMSLNHEIKCLWCDNNLTSLPCTTNHPDQRCCISGIQIPGIAKWECEKCGLPASDNITEEEAYCPLCDVTMIENTIL